MKSDSSIRNICIASIKRHTIAPYDFAFTKFFQKEILNEVTNERFQSLSVHENELPISTVMIDNNNFTIVTTKQIIACKDGVIDSIVPFGTNSCHWGDFKEYRNTPYTLGQITNDAKQVFEFLIETGRASMVTIYAIKTLIEQLSKKMEG